MLFVKEGTFHALKLCQFNAKRGRSCCLFCLLCNSFLKMWFCSYFFFCRLLSQEHFAEQVPTRERGLCPYFLPLLGLSSLSISKQKHVSFMFCTIKTKTAWLFYVSCLPLSFALSSVLLEHFDAGLDGKRLRKVLVDGTHRDGRRDKLVQRDLPEAATVRASPSRGMSLRGGRGGSRAAVQRNSGDGTGTARGVPVGVRLKL